jgi:hypothetical protein
LKTESHNGGHKEGPKGPKKGPQEGVPKKDQTEPWGAYERVPKAAQELALKGSKKRLQREPKGSKGAPWGATRGPCGPWKETARPEKGSVRIKEELL